MYCFIAILVTLICHSILAFTFLDPYIAVVIMGFAYSLLASALWPIVALIIPEYQLGTAYGLMQVNILNKLYGVILIYIFIVAIF